MRLLLRLHTVTLSFHTRLRKAVAAIRNWFLGRRNLGPATIAGRRKKIAIPSQAIGPAFSLRILHATESQSSGTILARGHQ